MVDQHKPSFSASIVDFCGWNIKLSTTVNVVVFECQPRPEPTCFKCQKLGHKANRYPQRSNEKPTNNVVNGNTRSQAQDNNYVQCTKCSGREHLAKDCSSRNLKCDTCQHMGYVKEVSRTGKYSRSNSTATSTKTTSQCGKQN